MPELVIFLSVPELVIFSVSSGTGDFFFFKIASSGIPVFNSALPSTEQALPVPGLTGIKLSIPEQITTQLTNSFDPSGLP